MGIREDDKCSTARRREYDEDVKGERSGGGEEYGLRDMTETRRRRFDGSRRDDRAEGRYR